jgi:hypothetical protein
MGRYYFDKKDTVEDCSSISISFLRKLGYLSGFPSGRIVWRNRDGKETASMGATVSMSGGEGHMRFWHTMMDQTTGKETRCDYKFELVTTPCNLGGVRWWFICPLSRNGVYCGRRVGKLYCPPGGKYYGCRHCYSLSYESRNESRHGRIAYMGHFLTLSTRLEKLWEQTNRLTYRGIPTKRIQGLSVLEAWLGAYSKAHRADLLPNR